MNGTIEFKTLAEMAEFLKAFTGTTAGFSAKYYPGREVWVIEFDGSF